MVLISYEGEHYPGKVVKVGDDGVVVSTMIKNKQDGWRWPSTPDELHYTWDDIVDVNNEAIPINNQGFLKFPVPEKTWGN